VKMARSALLLIRSPQHMHKELKMNVRKMLMLGALVAVSSAPAWAQDEGEEGDRKVSYKATTRSTSRGWMSTASW